MATFSVSITPGTTTADVFGILTGGDPSYESDKYRAIDLYIDGAPYSLIWASSPGGGDNYFYDTIEGLQPSTTYSYYAVLCYQEYPGQLTPTPSPLTESGTFTTLGNPTCHISVGSNNKTIYWNWTASANTWWNVGIDGAMVDYGQDGATSGSGSYTVSSYGTYRVSFYVSYTDGTSGSDYVDITISPPSINSFNVSQVLIGSNQAYYSFDLNADGWYYSIYEGSTYITDGTISGSSGYGNIILPFGRHTLILTVIFSSTDPSIQDTIEATVDMRRSLSNAFVYCTVDGVTDWTSTTPYVYHNGEWILADSNIYHNNDWRN